MLRTWSFPPRPWTHHTRWITPHPDDPDLIWIEVSERDYYGTPRNMEPER